MGFICDGAKLSCTHKVSFAGMNGMIAAKMVLDNQQTLSTLFYGLLPGFVASSFVLVVVSQKTQQPNDKALAWFGAVSQKLINS